MQVKTSSIITNPNPLSFNVPPPPPPLPPPPSLAFMAHIPLKELNTVADELINNYNVDRYMVTAELLPYEHMHFYVEFTNKDYERFRDNILKRKYKLHGIAGKKGSDRDGKPREYGRITKPLRDKTLYLSYIMKESVYCQTNSFLCDWSNCSTNIPQEELELIPRWEFKKIPGYEYSDYLKEAQKTDFIKDLAQYYN
mgnify:CR=1 FL=1